MCASTETPACQSRLRGIMSRGRSTVSRDRRASLTRPAQRKVSGPKVPVASDDPAIQPDAVGRFELRSQWEWNCAVNVQYFFPAIEKRTLSGSPDFSPINIDPL